MAVKRLYCKSGRYNGLEAGQPKRLTRKVQYSGGVAKGYCDQLVTHCANWILKVPSMLHILVVEMLLEEVFDDKCLESYRRDALESGKSRSTWSVEREHMES